MSQKRAEEYKAEVEVLDTMIAELTERRKVAWDNYSRAAWRRHQGTVEAEHNERSQRMVKNWETRKEKEVAA